jgi:cysteine desulfurase/selenocysteine lyase
MTTRSVEPGQPYQAVHPSRDVDEVRSDFPILERSIYGRPLVYLDNAATTHKPRPVLDALEEYHTSRNANAHRSAHYLSQQASEAYEHARRTVQGFINAPTPREIIFTSGTTESINLVARSYLAPRLHAGDEIVISALEHHSNLVPWQMLCRETGASLKIIPVRDDGAIDAHRGLALITESTRLLAVAEVSNVLGTITPLGQLIGKAHAHGAAVLIDGAQAAPHRPVDVQAMDCDFYAFSGHKLYAETGTGVLYGKQSQLEQMDPWQYGGGMIRSVDWEETTFAEVPYRFEAGTRHVAGVVSLSAAIEYIQRLGWENLARHESDLVRYAMDRLGEQAGVVLYGTARPKVGVVSFVLEGIQCFDAASILDKMGIAVRSGHHCAQPLMKRFGIEGALRASFACYNRRQDVDRLIDGLQRVRQMLA